jgi:uncharacterized membrane protein (UPF0127 family)
MIRIPLHMVRALAMAGLALLLALAAEAPLAAAGEPMLLPADPVPLVVGEGEAGARFTIEVAAAPAELERGLMYRTSMDDAHGMLFVFAETRPVAFWMKNTPMPLDLVFIGEDGGVRAVRRGEPWSTANIESGVPVRFVLELKAGMAEKAGIAEGVRLRHPLIAEASRRR